MVTLHELSIRSGEVTGDLNGGCDILSYVVLSFVNQSKLSEIGDCVCSNEIYGEALISLVVV
jgi:hypothetical protein